MRSLDRSLPFLSLLEDACRAEGRPLPAAAALQDLDPTLPDPPSTPAFSFAALPPVCLTPDAATLMHADHAAETRPMFVRPLLVGVLLDDGAPRPVPPPLPETGRQQRKAANLEASLALLNKAIEEIRDARPRGDGPDGAMKRRGHDIFLAAVEDFRAGRRNQARTNAMLALVHDKTNWVYMLAAELWSRQP